MKKVLEVTGTSHGNELPLLPEGGFAKEKRSPNNIVVWSSQEEENTPKNSAVWEAQDTQTGSSDFKKSPKGICLCIAHFYTLFVLF